MKEQQLQQLEKQLELHNIELINYECNVFEPALLKLNQFALEWFNTNLNIDLKDVRVDFNRISILPKIDSSPLDIYIRQNYKDYSYYCELNWYSSTAREEHLEHLLYLSLLGKVAENFKAIQNFIVHILLIKYKNIKNPLSEFYNEQHKIEDSIIKLKNEIDDENITEYKQPGFECMIKNFDECDWDLDKDNKCKYRLKEHLHTINIKYGASKYDRIQVKWFKVIGPAKYNKIKLEVKSLTSVLNPEYPSSILSVSKDTFDVFIRSVFMWNTKNAEVLSEQNKERCEKYNEEEKRWNE